jgi:outer membrane protein OmpA-like peptidoglycan-associated protein
MRYRITFLLCTALAACATTPPKVRVAPAPVGNVVYFPKLSTKITPAAAAVINRIAAEANSQPDTLVEIVGPSTRLVPGYSPGLASARFVAVEHALEAAGVPEKHIAHSAVSYFPADPDASEAQSFELRAVQDERPKSADGPRKHAAAGHQHYIH